MSLDVTGPSPPPSSCLGSIPGGFGVSKHHSGGAIPSSPQGACPKSLLTLPQVSNYTLPSRSSGQSCLTTSVTASLCS